MSAQDLWQASEVGEIWVTVPVRHKSMASITWATAVFNSAALLGISTGLTHPDLPPCKLVLCGMQSQVTMASVSFSTTVKVRPWLKAFSSLGSSCLVFSQSGRKASNVPPLNGFPGEGWPSWWDRMQWPQLSRSHWLKSFVLPLRFKLCRGSKLATAAYFAFDDLCIQTCSAWIGVDQQ